jgi:hypothetical protein
MVAEDHALALRRAWQGKAQPAPVLKYQRERERERERRQARARPRGQHAALAVRADVQGRVCHEGVRPHRRGGEAEGNQVMLVEDTPMKREKSDRPGDSVASG